MCAGTSRAGAVLAWWACPSANGGRCWTRHALAVMVCAGDGVDVVALSTANLCRMTERTCCDGCVVVVASPCTPDRICCAVVVIYVVG